MPVIAVLNEKGGSGKTTISTNLARCLQQEGHSVLLVDSDPQGSARDWYASAGEGSTLPPVVGLDRPALFKELPQISRDIDWVIIDGAPQIEELAVSAIKAADTVLIPVQPSPYDIWAVEPLVELVKARREITDGKPQTAFVVSRQITGTRLATDIRQALEEYRLPLFKTGTSQRVIYPNSAASGSSVIDSEPDGPAAKEIRDLAAELTGFMGGNH
jgi:chromosome partitioning protein